MPKIEYVKKKLRPATLEIVEKVNDIIASYMADGFDLTLRQVYYQCIARDLFPITWINTDYNARKGLPPDTKNTERNYKRLGDVIAAGRMAGLIDWEAITDRTRNLRKESHWTDPGDIIKSAASSFHLDRWKGQKTRVECFIEKDALIGILEAVCPRNDVPYFSCRGYTSLSEMWVAAQRIGKWIRAGTNVTVLHLGDHDPSGVDMSRDIEERVKTFLRTDHINDRVAFLQNEIKEGRLKKRAEFDSDEAWGSYCSEAMTPLCDDIVAHYGQFELRRIALTMDQIEEHNPPPNPAKNTDARYRAYQQEYGDTCWELDALDPTTLVNLIQAHIDSCRDAEQWDKVEAEEKKGKKQLDKVSANWKKVVPFLRSL
jgi:hypothetical protein